MIKEKLLELFDVLKNKHICAGEAVIVIYRTFNKDFNLPEKWISYSTMEPVKSIWELLPDSSLDELKQFVINNCFRFYEILQPKQHRQIMEMKTQEALQYQEYYKTRGNSGKKLMSDAAERIEPWWNKE
jgi:hypothetical protein